MQIFASKEGGEEEGEEEGEEGEEGEGEGDASLRKTRRGPRVGQCSGDEILMPVKRRHDGAWPELNLRRHVI